MRNEGRLIKNLARAKKEIEFYQGIITKTNVKLNYWKRRREKLEKMLK